MVLPSPLMMLAWCVAIGESGFASSSRLFYLLYLESNGHGISRKRKNAESRMLHVHARHNL